MIVLYNGESGGGIKGEPMGICHSELEAALATQSGKVRGIALPMAAADLYIVGGGMFEDLRVIGSA